MSLATISMTFFLSASLSVIATLLRTASIAHSALRPRFCAMTFAERSGEVLDLLAHHAFDFLAAAGHRMGRADVGARRHGGHMSRQRDEHAGRTGPGAARSDPDHNGDLRTKHFFNDGARRIEQAAGRVHLHDQRPGTVVFGARDAFTNVSRPPPD